MQPASLLVMHGSRDPRPQIAIARLAHRIQQRTDTIVGTAALECTSLPLHEQIQQFALHHGIRDLQIVPLFLLPGVHVMEDIPEQVEIAQHHMPAVKLHLRSHLGAEPALRQMIRDRFANSSGTRILLSHGSRRPNANQPIEQLAHQVNAIPAYWSVPPNLETQVSVCLERDAEIAILPYFLFSGGITDAIARSIQSLRQQFPQAKLDLLTPLDESEELADIVVHLMQPTANSPYLVM